MTELNDIEAGDTLNVTIKTNGTEDDGQLTVVENPPEPSPIKVQNSNGDTFDLVLHSDDNHPDGVLGRNGRELATVHNIEVA